MEFITDEIKKTQEQLNLNREEFEKILNNRFSFFDFVMGNTEKKSKDLEHKLRLNCLEHTFLCEKLYHLKYQC